MNSCDLKEKRALVTGGSKGIGKSIVHEFLALDVLWKVNDLLQQRSKE